MFRIPTWQTMLMGVAVFTVTCGALPVFAKPDADASHKIVIVHTNDIHGNLTPDSKGRGGLTRIATLISQIRKQNPGRVIYLDAGDVAQGTPISNIFHGEPVFAAIKSMDPVAGTLGNHEFDWGVKVMHNMLSKADYPILAANVVNRSTGKPDFEPYRIVVVDGIKVGIIGLTTPEAKMFVKKGNTGNYRFLDAAPTVRQYLPQMKADGAQIFVVLSHMGVDDDKALAAEVPDIDVIVGGHSHTALEEPVVVGDHTWIVQAGCKSRNLGVVEMVVSPVKGKVLAFSSRLVPIDSKAGIAEDPTVTAIAKKYDEKVRPIMQQRVGETAGELTKAPATDSNDGTLGNAICDAMATKSDSQIAVYNFGGIRADSIPSGVVTRENIFLVLPFDDQVVKMEIKGKDIISIMNQSARSEVGPLQVSGLTCTIDLSKKIAKDIMVGGKPIDPEATYTLATTEFLSGGQDGFKALANGKIVDRFEFARDLFIDYLDDSAVLAVPTTGRIKLIGK